MSSKNNEIFASAREAYTFVRGKEFLNLPDTFESLTPEQQDFFMDFFDACKEIEYETVEQQSQECTDEFIVEVNQQLGIAGENAVENILYMKNMKVVYDN